MVNQEQMAGIGSYLIFGEETTYATAASAIASTFGIVHSQKITMKNNLKKISGFKDTSTTGRETVKVIAGAFEGSGTVEFTPLLWNWLKYVLGAVSGSGTVAAPYVYVAAALPTSLTISHCIDNVTTDREELLLGCMVTSVTIKAAMGEQVTVSMDYGFADIDKDATLTSNVAYPAYEPFSFAGATLEIPNATPVSNIIDSIEITITTGTEIKTGLGSRVGRKANPKELDYSVKFTVKYVDETLIEKFLGGSAGPSTSTPAADATLAVRFENSATHYVDFIFSSGYVDEYGEEAVHLAMIGEDLTFVTKSLTVNEVKTT